MPPKKVVPEQTRQKKPRKPISHDGGATGAASSGRGDGEASHSSDPLRSRGVSIQRPTLQVGNFRNLSVADSRKVKEFMRANTRPLMEEFQDLFGVESERVRELLEKLEDRKSEVQIKALNAISNEINTYHAVRRDVVDIPLGTEFTFSHPELRNLILLDDEAGKQPEVQQAIAVAMDKMGRWKDAVARAVPRPVVEEFRDPKGVEPRGGLAYRFHYKLSDGKDWNWTLGMDNGCLETQTAKLPFRNMNDADDADSHLINQIIDEHVFGTSPRIDGLQPDPSSSGGGGHLSFDGEESFGGSAELLLETLSYIQSRHTEWSLHFDEKDPAAADPVNAPWVVELKKKGRDPQDELALYNQQIGQLKLKVEGGELDFVQAVKEMIHFTTSSYVNPNTDPERGLKQHLAIHQDFKHYQAINLENLEGKEAGARRIEFRRVAAQTGLIDLKGDIDRALMFLNDAKQIVRQNQEVRLGLVGAD